MQIAPLVCLYAQPRIEINGGDTSAVITLKSLREANVRFIELSECREEKDSLFSQNRTYKGLVANQKSTILELKEAIKIDAVLISDKQKIIDISDKQLKKSEKKIKLIKLERNSFVVICIVLLSKILIFK